MLIITTKTLAIPLLFLTILGLGFVPAFQKTYAFTDDLNFILNWLTGSQMKQKYENIQNYCSKEKTDAYVKSAKTKLKYAQDAANIIAKNPKWYSDNMKQKVKNDYDNAVIYMASVNINKVTPDCMNAVNSYATQYKAMTGRP